MQVPTTWEIEVAENKLEKANVTSILENPCDELLYDIQPEGPNLKAMSCPEIAITLENTRVNVLIDTDSEITSTLEGFYYAKQKFLRASNSSN